MRDVETCSVVDRFCTSPANVVPLTRARGVCFRCGGAVCSKCSTKRPYLHYGRVRLCNDCQVEEDGNQDVVMRRLHRLARGGVSGNRELRAHRPFGGIIKVGG